jgi:septal ring factor EnvC (AmiA/AmiB activator)
MSIPMTPAEQRLLLNEIEKQIALLQTRLRTLGDSEQEELNSLKKLIQTLIKNEREKERKREREKERKRTGYSLPNFFLRNG